MEAEKPLFNLKRGFFVNSVTALSLDDIRG